MYGWRYFLLSILTFIFSGSDVSAQFQKYDPNITCYGETLAVRMVGTDRNGDIISEVFLKLPYRDHWWGVKLGHDEYLQYADCLPEPVTSNEIAYGGFRRSQANPVSFPNGFRELRIHSYGNLDVALQFLPERIKRFDEKGVDLQDGFRWRGQTQERDGDYATALGTYLFPENHLSPIGTRIIRSCGFWTCNSEYPLTENLIVSMEFWNTVPYLNWIEHDREMQRVLKSLIEEKK